MRMLQVADSVTRGALMKHSILFTGASGGSYSVAYFRGLYLEKLSNPSIRLYDEKYSFDLARDLLNPLCFAIVVNDLFYPWQKFTKGGYRYRKDRAYLFEKVLSKNTGGMLEKKISSYRDAELSGTVPMLLLSPTIINDERNLFISAQPVSYLTHPAVLAGNVLPDGIDMMHFFRYQDASNLSLITALRMNSTYPFILPNVFLPSEPPVEVMDAGIRDNLGFENIARFIHVFRDWINAHTSGVVVVQISCHFRVHQIEDFRHKTAFSKLFTPIGNLYKNWSEIQKYHQDYLRTYASEWLNGNFQLVQFEYAVESEKDLPSLSFHLTEREKHNILKSVNSAFNQNSLRELQELLR
jgi:hypothetical protein